MNARTVKGYLMTVSSGLLLLTALLLVIMQLGRVASFSLFNYSYEITITNGKLEGGVRTAWLMIVSAIGGVGVFLLAKMFIAGVMALRKGKRQQTQQNAAKRLAELEKTQQTSATQEAAKDEI